MSDSKFTPEWIVIDTPSKAAIDEIVYKARHALRDYGFETRTPRFPFAMHHDFYRTKIRVAGRKPRHNEIAMFLSTWSLNSGLVPTHAYIWQAIAGAINSMDPRATKEVPAWIEENIQEVGRGEQFLQWLRALLIVDQRK